MLERVKAGCLVTPDCWIWLGLLDEKGYGRIKIKGLTRRTHIVTYEHVHGARPTGSVIDHLCRVRHCCNPQHLQAVSPAENNRRGLSPSAQRRRQTRCVHGHELTPDNIYSRPDRPGMRECRTCKRLNRKRTP